MSFRDEVDIVILRTLSAFSVMKDLKVLDPPQWASYIQFQSNQVPYTKYITQLTKPYYVSYSGDEQSIFQLNLGSKTSRKLEVAEQAYEQEIENECKALL